MIENIKFSIIISIYNIENYIEDCLNSILNQSYKNLEIICVNNSSTDNSTKILREYAKKDKRIIVLNQKNKGTKTARDNGMKLATGDYLSFIDPDDWFDLNTFEKLNNVINKRHSEVVELDYKIYCKASQIFEHKKELKKKCFIQYLNQVNLKIEELSLIKYHLKFWLKKKFNQLYVYNNINGIQQYLQKINLKLKNSTIIRWGSDM